MLYFPSQLEQQYYKSIQKVTLNRAKRSDKNESITNRSQLDSYVTCRTWALFHNLRLNQSFLDNDVKEWKSDDEFVKSQSVIKQLKVVNDTAERGIALIQNYMKGTTIREDQLQYLLQVVEYQRSILPKCRKQDIVKVYSKK